MELPSRSASPGWLTSPVSRRPRLHTRFRQEVGQSPGEYILRAKIERARDLLADTDLSVTDIAYSLSFSSAQYFATAFKRLTRATPTSFRRSLKGLEMT